MSASGDQARDVQWMERALAIAREAAARGEVPVGAIVVRGGEILGSAHDAKEIDLDPTAHAEILAIRRACVREGDWRLDGAELYVTMEPCPMCAGAIVHARIARLIYAAPSPRWGACGTEVDLLRPGLWNHTVEVTPGVCREEAAELLRETFRRYRSGDVPKPRGGQSG